MDRAIIGAVRLTRLGNSNVIAVHPIDPPKKVEPKTSPPSPSGGLLIHTRYRRYLALVLLALSVIYSFASFGQTVPPRWEIELRDGMSPWLYMAAINYALNPGLPHSTLDPSMNFQRLQLHNTQVAHIPIYPPGVGYMVVSSNPASLGAAINVINGTRSELVLTPLVQQSFTANCVCRPLQVTVFRGPETIDGQFIPLTKPLDNPKYRSDLFVDIVP